MQTLTASQAAADKGARTWTYEAIGHGRFVVRPEGCLGTCGWDGGKPWAAQFVTGAAKASKLAATLTLAELTAKEQAK